MENATYNNLPVKVVVPLKQMVGEDDEDTKLLGVMAEAAQNYMRCFPWCKRIREVYFGDGYSGIVAVFLFHIEAEHAEIDEWLWVVFGDVPPAYLVTDIAKSPSQALEGYMAEISKWVELGKEGKSSKDVMPVWVPATRENVADIERRMKVLRDVIVPAFREAEAVRA